MDRQKIAIEDFDPKVFEILNKKWMLLNGGDFEKRKNNPMTISWGMFGTMWFKPVVLVGVRPQRFTLKYLTDYDSFTLNAFPENCKDILSFCGSYSGHDCDKVAECKLTPIASESIDCGGFDQANLIIECKKLYSSQISGKNFIDKAIVANCYPDRDFHHLFVAEVLNIWGAEEFH